MEKKIIRISEGVWQQYLCDRQVVVWKLFDMTRQTVDAWVESCLREMYRCFRDDQEIRALQDLSERNVTQTPYGTERGEEVAKAYPELRGRTAAILPPTIDAHRIRLFFKRTVTQETRQRDVFNDPVKALAYITEGLDCAPPPSLIWED